MSRPQLGVEVYEEENPCKADGEPATVLVVLNADTSNLLGRAGVQKEDILVSWNSTPLCTKADLRKCLAETNLGGEVRLRTRPWAKGTDITAEEVKVFAYQTPQDERRQQERARPKPSESLSESVTFTSTNEVTHAPSSPARGLGGDSISSTGSASSSGGGGNHQDVDALKDQLRRERERSQRLSQENDRLLTEINDIRVNGSTTSSQNSFISLGGTRRKGKLNGANLARFLIKDISDQLPSTDYKMLWQAFLTFDTSMDGVIDTEEMDGLIREMDPNCSADQLAKYRVSLRPLGEDGDDDPTTTGGMTFVDFWHWWDSQKLSDDRAGGTRLQAQIATRFLGRSLISLVADTQWEERVGCADPESLQNALGGYSLTLYEVAIQKAEIAYETSRGLLEEQIELQKRGGRSPSDATVMAELMFDQLAGRGGQLSWREGYDLLSTLGFPARETTKSAIEHAFGEKNLRREDFVSVYVAFRDLD